MKFASRYKARHAHKRLYTVLPKYSKIQVLPGITSCRLMKDNKQAIELNDLLKKLHCQRLLWNYQEALTNETISSNLEEKPTILPFPG